MWLPLKLELSKSVKGVVCSRHSMYRVEAPITNPLRDSTPSLEKYKVVQNFPM